MTQDSIADLLHPFLSAPLSSNQYHQVERYIGLLTKWNARINLTAIRNEVEVVTRHFGESFFLAQHLFPAESVEPRDAVREAVRVIDIGSGAGFPAMPLAIWAPQASVTMIESNHKKAAFLREVVRSLELRNAVVVSERAEILAAHPDFQRAEVVTMRAVEHFREILPTAVTLLVPGGRLGLLVGESQTLELTASVNVVWDAPLPVPLSQSRRLVIGRN